MANTLKTISTEIENITTFYFKRLIDKRRNKANKLIKITNTSEIGINPIINLILKICIKF